MTGMGLVSLVSTIVRDVAKSYETVFTPYLLKKKGKSSEMFTYET
jgi:hypothetical protein